jgi:hypothetical protein
MNHHHQIACAVLNLALAIIHGLALLPLGVIVIAILLFVVITTPSDGRSPLRVGRSGIHLEDGWGTAMNHHHHLACASLYLALAIVNAAALLPLGVIVITILLFVVITTPSGGQVSSSCWEKWDPPQGWMGDGDESSASFRVCGAVPSAGDRQRHRIAAAAYLLRTP